MKLVVTIPAYNEEENISNVINEIPRSINGIDKVEVLVLDDGSVDRTVELARQAGADHVISHKANKGLAQTFKDLLEEALRIGADIIVNTDADNHYDQSRIPDLIHPILQNKADVVIGSRKVEKLEKMPFFNKYGNIIGSFITTKLAGLPKIDVSTGFRAYSKEAALKINVFSLHTYTHSTLISAADHKLVIREVPIKARPVMRKSRLIPNIPHFIINAGSVILRNIILFKPLRFFLTLGIIVTLPGLALVFRFLYFYFFTETGGQGHVQSLIIAAIFIMIGFQISVLGLIASAIGWNRKLIEEVSYRLKKEEFNKANKG